MSQTKFSKSKKLELQTDLTSKKNNAIERRQTNYDNSIALDINMIDLNIETIDNISNEDNIKNCFEINMHKTNTLCNQNNKLILKYINIQGLSDCKVAELENLMKNNNEIMFLTETQMKYDKLKENNLEIIHKMRESGDKKGGGPCIMKNKDSNIKIEQKKINNSDVMHIVINTKHIKINILLVYFPVNNKKKDRIRNIKIRKDIECCLPKIEGNIMIIGDFNGHIQEIGYQKEDYNIKVIKDIASKHNFIILNMDDRCKGKTTWERNQQKSTIDFVLINEEMSKITNKMNIDENKNIFDLSDHNLLELEIIAGNSKINFKNKWTKTEYISFKENHIEKFLETMETELQKKDISNMETLNNLIKQTLDSKLKKVYKKKIDKNYKREKPWINAQIRETIDLRKKYNRLKRNEKNEEMKSQYEKLYKEYKVEGQVYVKQEIEKYERKLTNLIKKNRNDKTKKWKYIKMLEGKEIKKKDVYIYKENGSKMSEEDEKGEIKSIWNNIYQKHGNNILNVWNENEYRDKSMDKVKIFANSKFSTDHNGVIKTIVNEKEITNDLAEHYDMVSRINRTPINKMKKVEFTTEKIKKQILKTKYHKAPGPDTIKNEIYKNMAQNETCLKTLTKCMINELESERKPTSWKSSNMNMLAKDTKPTANQL